MSPKDIEKYSSAITLSDMEVFVFPELVMSLVLANIMSPVIWQWRDLDCFKKLEGKSSYKKLLRLKQFIIDEYEFNLDLETWGLTTQKKELQRFASFISPEDIAATNALFGYEGDQYYFDVDIRRHFGLDRYNSDVIPYWKTETVEAMNAFRLKPGYKTGAGECVSLSTLYAAAAFVVCGIALEDIFIIQTPLHSQNFIDIDDGVLTNNRRLVTKTMWFNGTALTEKAQRALRNEQVTIVAHNSGFIHCFYKDATIKKAEYERFLGKINLYLTAELTLLTFANFLRNHRDYQRYFIFCCEGCRGGSKYAKAEVLFAYEHGSRFRIAEDTFEKLIDEMSEEDLLPYKLPSRVCCNHLASFIKYENIDISRSDGIDALKKYLAPFVPPVDNFVKDLVDFLHIRPRLPSAEKTFVAGGPIELSTDFTREQVIEYLSSIRAANSTADLAFYAYRDMGRCEWSPFVKAAVERSPVSIEKASSMSLDDVYTWLKDMKNTSIYDGQRLAQPDEVANYGTGDGIEKALLMANVICARKPEQTIEITVNHNDVTLKADAQYVFVSGKALQKTIRIPE
jgi:hypothetical protein